MNISAEQYRRLVQLLSDLRFTSTIDNRQALLANAGLRRFRGSLNFDVNSYLFSSQLVRQLLDFGTLDGRPALEHLLRFVRTEVEGRDADRDFIDQLLAGTQPPLTPASAQPMSPVRGDVLVFISYSSANRGFARQVADALEKAGVRVWWDQHREHGIQPSQDWERLLRQKLDEATHVVVILTPRSVESDMVRAELQISFSANPRKILIPLLAETLPPNTMPMQLVPLQYIDFRNVAQFQDRIEALVRTINEHA